MGTGRWNISYFTNAVRVSRNKGISWVLNSTREIFCGNCLQHWGTTPKSSLSTGWSETRSVSLVHTKIYYGYSPTERTLLAKGVLSQKLNWKLIQPWKNFFHMCLFLQLLHTLSCSLDQNTIIRKISCLRQASTLSLITILNQRRAFFSTLWLLDRLFATIVLFSINNHGLNKQKNKPNPKMPWVCISYNTKLHHLKYDTVETEGAI